MYIYDYCKKKKFHQAARAFSADANVPTDQPPPFDVSTGFLGDWWNVFWDIYYAKSKEADASKEATVIDEVSANVLLLGPEMDSFDLLVS